MSSVLETLVALVNSEEYNTVSESLAALKPLTADVPNLAPHVAVLADVLPRLKGVALGLAPALIPMPQPPETE